jgi:hypothetical protein
MTTEQEFEILEAHVRVELEQIQARLLKEIQESKTNQVLAAIKGLDARLGRIETRLDALEKPEDE